MKSSVAKVSKSKIKIDGKSYPFENGQTIMAVARKNGIAIPALCGHPDFPPKGNCRVCVVEVKNRRNLVTSCSTLAEDGMEVFTDSERAAKSRNINLELIFAEHVEKCPTCVWRMNCKLLEYAKKYNIKITRFQDRKKDRKTYKFGNSVELDGSQCIDCRNCIDACTKIQKIDHLILKGKGANQEVCPTADRDKACIQCGQCAMHCPVGAAQEQTSWFEVEQLLKNKNGKTVVVQIAPSVRVSIGEEFGQPSGKVTAEQLAAGLRRLGFDYVFDVNYGADITTMVEAAELLERLATGGTLPMFTSCCPGWVNYVELYHPQLIPNLTTARSPHIHSGAVIKSYWAKEKKVNPKDIVMISIMPCTAKKFEASREELKFNGMRPVDMVLTVREAAWLLKKNNVDLPKMPKEELDYQTGEHSGASVIYGASGGVMESALRTAQHIACGSQKASLCERRIDFQEVRGLEGVKKATIDVAGSKLRVGVVSGIGNVRQVIDNINDYDYVEVMACVGGCLGGGGQAYPTTPDIRKARMEALYSLDKKNKIRKAHENKHILRALEWVKNQGEHFEHQVLHTKFFNRRGKRR